MATKAPQRLILMVDEVHPQHLVFHIEIQTYRCNEFGHGGHYHKGDSGFVLESANAPEMCSSQLFVWGDTRSSDHRRLQCILPRFQHSLAPAILDFNQIYSRNRLGYADVIWLAPGVRLDMSAW